VKDAKVRNKGRIKVKVATVQLAFTWKMTTKTACVFVLYVKRKRLFMQLQVTTNPRKFTYQARMVFH